MAHASPRITLYPGCSLEGTASAYWRSLEAVFGKLGLEVPALREWSCCGATSAHVLDHDLHLALTLRNLWLAQEQGFEEIMAPCAACYHRLAGANLEFQADASLLDRMNQRTGLRYHGKVRVRNVLDLLFHSVGVEHITQYITRPLKGLSTVCYYGCLNTRLRGAAPFDDVEYPRSMDLILKSAGACVIDWSYKTECCGASHFITQERACTRLVSDILQDAAERGARCVAVACPMCQNNLEARQEAVVLHSGQPCRLPVLYWTQLLGLAMGFDPGVLQMNQLLIPFEYVHA